MHSTLQLVAFWSFLNIAAGFFAGLIFMPFRGTVGIEEHSIFLIRLFICGGLIYYIRHYPCTNINNETWSSLHQNKLNNLLISGKYLLYYILGAALLTAALAGIIYSSEHISGNPNQILSIGSPRFEALRSSAFGGITLYLVGVCLIAPVIEEVFYRQLLYTELRKYLSPAISIPVIGLFFGLFHPNFVIASLDGAYLSYVYEREKSLAVNIILHALLNVLSILILTGIR